MPPAPSSLAPLALMTVVDAPSSLFLAACSSGWLACSWLAGARDRSTRGSRRARRIVPKLALGCWSWAPASWPSALRRHGPAADPEQRPLAAPQEVSLLLPSSWPDTQALAAAPLQLASYAYSWPASSEPPRARGLGSRSGKSGSHQGTCRWPSHRHLASCVLPPHRHQD